jgi:NAD+ diphosphatase
VFQGRDLLVRQGPGGPELLPGGADGAPPLAVEGARCIGVLDGVPCWAARATPGAVPEGTAPAAVRTLFDRLDDGLLAVAGRAEQVLEFDRTRRFCGVCGGPTVPDDGGRARRCPSCSAVYYPPLAPAMMVLVTRGGPAGRELLLARGRRFSTPIYSALAGFVEPSETLEEAIHREVREEVGVSVSGLRYFGSQAWPFPHSLMVAFLAEHAAGEIACDPEEIVDARWFPVDRLPLLPHRLSVARRLIEHAVAEAGGGG